MADETTAAKTEELTGAARLHGGLTNGTADSAELVDASTDRISAATAKARTAVLGDKGASITVRIIAFLIAWPIKIVTYAGMAVLVFALSPILLCGWAMDKTFGDDW